MTIKALFGSFSWRRALRSLTKRACGRLRCHQTGRDAWHILFESSFVLYAWRSQGRLGDPSVLATPRILNWVWPRRDLRFEVSCPCIALLLHVERAGEVWADDCDWVLPPHCIQLCVVDFCRAKLALTRSVEHAHDEGLGVCCFLFKLVLCLTIDFLVDWARFQLFSHTLIKLYRIANLRNLTAKIDE